MVRFFLRFFFTTARYVWEIRVGHYLICSFFVGLYFSCLVIVNVRLLGERLEQNEQPKPNHWESQQARWPALYACPNCWREDGSWEEEKVYDHLRAVFWSGNPSYLKIPSSGDGGGPSSRVTPLRWALSLIVFAVVAFILRLYRAKKVRRNSGRHKK